MPMLLVMVSMWVARQFGFRHREVEDELSIFRVPDAFAGLLLSCGAVLGVGAGIDALVPGEMPNWVNNLLGALGFGIVIFGATVWMPFVEHLSQFAPGELTAPIRSKVVILARAIPYLYGVAVVLMSLAVAPLMVLFFGMALLGIAIALGFDQNSVSTATQLWIGGAISLAFGLFLARVLVMSSRLVGDWGLPEWYTFVEPGQKRPAGERVFGPLDATLGRFVLKGTGRPRWQRPTFPPCASS